MSSKATQFKARISKKITELSYKDVEFPKTAASTLNSFLKASNPKTSASNEFKVAVCPDLIPTFLFLINDALEQRSSLIKLQNAKVSHYTYLAYNLNLIYMWFVIHDLYITPGNCFYAEDLIENEYFASYLEDVLDYPMPHAVTTVIANWTTSNDENQTNLWYGPSFCNFMHHTHFGRYIPVNLLFAAHDIIADASPNLPAPEATYMFATTPVLNITAHVADPFAATPAAAAHTVLVNNYFGLLYPYSTNTDPTNRQHTSTYVNSKVNQLVHSFLDFDSIKGMKAQGRFTATGIKAPSVKNDLYNPYTVLTCLTKSNIHELTVIYNAVSSVIVEEKLANTNVAKAFSDMPSSGILNHGYCSFPLPHWDYKTYLNDTYSESRFVRNDKFVPITRTDLTTFATNMRFKTDFSTTAWTPSNLHIGDLRVNVTTQPSPAPTQLTALAVSVRFSESAANISSVHWTGTTVDIDPLQTNPTNILWNELSNQGAATAPDFTTSPLATGPLRTFDESIDVFPKIKVTGPHGLTTLTAPLTCLRGLLIYSDELAASIVLHLQSSSDVQDDNIQFLQSAIPYSHTHLATNFRTTDPVASRVSSVPTPSMQFQPATTMIRRPNQVFATNVLDRVFHIGYDTITPGMTEPASIQQVPIFNQTFIGQQVATRSYRNREPRVFESPNTPYGHLLCWSAYTYRRSDVVIDSDIASSTTAADIAPAIASLLKETYYITNLRTIFGSSRVVIECNSPISSMPVFH